MLAGVILNGMICGALFRPLPALPDDCEGAIAEQITEQPSVHPSFSTGTSHNSKTPKLDYSIESTQQKSSYGSVTLDESVDRKPQHKRLLELQDLNLQRNAEPSILHSVTSLSSSQATLHSTSGKRTQLFRKDVFYTGSITSLTEYQNAEDYPTYVASVTNVSQLSLTGAKEVSTLHMMKDVIDFSIFTSLTFLTLCLASILSMMGMYSFD